MILDVLVWLGLVAGAAGVATGAAALRDVAWASRASKTAWLVSAGAMAAAFIGLVALFIRTDLVYEYVFLYTRDGLPLRYRIAGAWAGREGSLLLWATFMAAITAWLHRKATSEGAALWTRVAMGVLTLAFLAVAVAQDTFRATPEFFLQGRPGGNGLNPTLQSDFFLIHPPMMFLAYALAALPAAAGLGHMVAGHGAWSRVVKTASRLDWVLYSFAMGLGGIWAYYTLGFGGYWAWDPVEVANLLPWLALTLFLHAAWMHRRNGDYAATGPMLAVLPFVFTLFSTVSTRSGLWISVHAFTDPTGTFNPDASGRMLDIIAAEPGLGPYIGLLVGVLLAALALWTRRLAIDLGTVPRTAKVVGGVLAAAAVWALIAPASFLSVVFEAAYQISGGRTGLGSLGLLVAASVLAALPLLLAKEEPADGRTGWARIQTRTWGAAAVLLLMLALVVATLFHFNAVNGWDRVFWEVRIPWLVTPIAAAMSWFLLQAGHGAKGAVRLVAGGLLLSFVAFIIWGLGAYAITLAALTLAAATERLARTAFLGPRKARLSSGLLWLSGILAVVFWWNPPHIELGVMSWAAQWPTQLVMGSLAVVGLAGAHLVGLGRRIVWPYVLLGVLAAFYVGALLALLAWILAPTTGRDRRPKPARLRQVAVYGVHFAVAFLFVGYSLSTYFYDSDRQELAPDEAIMVGGQELVWSGTDYVQEAGTPWAAEWRPTFTSADGSVDGLLYWESQTSSHYPLPQTLRLWHRDVYINLKAICFEEDACADGGWMRAFEMGGRPSINAVPTGVDVEVRTLPGLGLVWASLAFFVAYGAPLVWDVRKQTGQKASG